LAAVPQCAVVIPTYNGAYLLRPCLEALLANPPVRCGWQIIVVDDASTDQTLARLAEHGDRVTVLAQETNGGFAVACNAGARVAADADYVVFLNNDTVPVAGWLDALVDTAVAHPEAGAVGARLLFPDGTVQHAGIAIGQDRWPHHIYAGFPGEHPAVTRPKQVIAATAACLLVRRQVFELLGGFDTAFHNGYEDVDFCLRMGEAGHEIQYCPKSVVTHLESVTRWSDQPVSTEPNDRLFRERWSERVAPDDVQHYLDDGLVSIRYGAYFPLELSVSPLLATLRRDGTGDDPLEQLLGARSRQVMELLAERTRATLRQQRRTEDARPLTSGRKAAPSVRELRRGGTHRLGGAPSRHLVSVVMPLRNAGGDLPEILSRLLSQHVSTLLEIIAVDSSSEDDTVALLTENDATVLQIDPADFDHGLTRNLAAQHAKGDIVVLLNQRTRIANDDWLAPLIAALDEDPRVAGACSRIGPRPDAGLLTRRDGELELSGNNDRAIKRIDDWDAYRAMTVDERRLLLNFHTVAAAVRADVLARIPFRSVRTIGEDLLWAREVLESGLALVHEPASLAYHSHDYSLRDWFERNVDDGVANRDIAGRGFEREDVLPMVHGMVASDWRYLRETLGLEGDELEHWQVEAALRRLAQATGQWLGANHEDFTAETIDAFSRIANARRTRP
jgi:GT2 family glycosyltransferase